MQGQSQVSRYAGVGVHSGKQVEMKIYPADANTGIVFVSPFGEVSTNYKHVIETRLYAVLGIGKARVAMVEHLLAAFNICDIHNAIVSISAEELPILDGSAAPYCNSFVGNWNVRRQRHYEKLKSFSLCVQYMAAVSRLCLRRGTVFL